MSTTSPTTQTGNALSAQELRALHAATSVLARASSASEVIRIVVEHGTTATASVRGGMWLLDSRLEALELAHSSGFGTELRERCERFWIQAELPTRAIEAAMVEGLNSCAVLPVLCGDVTGCIAFARARRFEGDEQRFLSILAQLCGQALERTTLFESERAARRASEVLYQLMNAMSLAKGKSEILDVALDTLQSAIGIRRVAVLTCDAQGVMRFDAWCGISDDYRSVVEGHSPWSPADLDPVPVAVTDTETSAELAPFLEAFRREGIRSLAFVPLVRERRAVGKFMLYGDAPRHFSEHELQVALTVASHVAQALERERSRVEIEEALRAREEILQIVSHDLRTPLAAIVLTNGSLLDVVGPKERRLAERIARNTQRMVRLIDDLVDFGAIRAGRLSIRTASCSAGEIVSRAVETFGPMAEERKIRLVAQPTDTEVVCDRDRVVQALSNLISNAIAMCPAGAAVEVAVDRLERDLLFAVTDTGPGIDPAELPNLFDRYRRGTGAGYKGAGLGLAIAKGIVEAHGGRISAENIPGSGARFVFTLPSHP